MAFGVPPWRRVVFPQDPGGARAGPARLPHRHEHRPRFLRALPPRHQRAHITVAPKLPAAWGRVRRHTHTPKEASADKMVLLFNTGFCRCGGKLSRFRKYSSVAICVTGLVLVVFSDVHAGDRAGGTSPVKGDILVIAGAILYAISNVSEEFLVKAGDRIELMGMLGLFGAIISACQMYPILIFCEHASYFTFFALVVPFIWFAVAMFMFYSLVPILPKISGSTLLNLSLLTSDMWAILIRVFAYHEKVDWMYYVAFGAVAVGLVTFSSDTHDEERPGQVGEAGECGGRLPDEEAAGDPRCLDAASSSSRRFEDGKCHYQALVNEEREVQQML